MRLRKSVLSFVLSFSVLGYFLSLLERFVRRWFDFLFLFDGMGFWGMLRRWCFCVFGRFGFWRVKG